MVQLAFQTQKEQKSDHRMLQIAEQENKNIK